MGATSLFLLGILTVVPSIWFYNKIFADPPKHNFPLNGYFGKGASKPDDQTIRPFKIHVPDEQIADLKNRLKNARITHDDLEETVGFEYGFPKNALLYYLDHWLNKYDWRVAEKKLNAFNHFKTQIEGLNIHFIHQKPPKGKYKKVTPILLSHGWPGSVHEFSKIIPILVDPKANGIADEENAFEVVVPSIPGYGWSDSPLKKGMNSGAIARIFHKLMMRLKINRYVTQGGDWGSTIVSNIDRLYPEHIIGTHLNMFSSFRNDVVFKSVLASFFPKLVFGDQAYSNYNFLATLKFFIIEGGYFHIQATYPHTLGIGLNDSPIGLLSWMMEKLIGATKMEYARSNNAHELIQQRLSTDDLLTAVSIYWFNGNMLQAARLYKENIVSSELHLLSKQYITVPTGFAGVECDAVPPVPRSLVEMVANVTYYSEIRDLGHFVAWEGPLIFAKDIFAFVKTL